MNPSSSSSSTTTPSVNLKAFKIVYVPPPMKALVQEVVANFGRRLAPYDIIVVSFPATPTSPSSRSPRPN